MYKCDEHGDLESEWCGECGAIKACDHSDMTTTRQKDFLYDCDDGEMSITMHLHHCDTCGYATHVEI